MTVLLAVAALTCGVSMVGVVTLASAPPAQAASTSVSDFTKSATDLASNSTADSATGARGSARPGDTIKWALNYKNKTGADATVAMTDPIASGQTFVPNSIQTPPRLTGSVTGSTLTVNGTVLSGATANQSPNFNAAAVNFNTPGGDGYSVEGFGNSIYTVFHHNASSTVVFCATLTNQVCPGWPAFSSYVSPTAGTPLGTGPVSTFASEYVNGSFIEGGRLYWGVEQNGTPDVFGMQCLDLTSLLSCGYNQLGTTTVGGYAASGDGIKAADGNYHYMDNNGKMQCVTPTGTSCGAVDVAGAPVGHGGVMEVGTYGRYVYASFDNGTTNQLTCLDTSTSTKCAGFPKATGPFDTVTGFESEVMPVVSSAGAFLGACAIVNNACFDPSGNAIPNPWSLPRYSFSPSNNQGFGTGVLVGTKYYTGHQDVVDCYDFARPLAGGKVQPCAAFATHPPDAQSYTVRQLANLPGCMASNGNASQISVFNAVTGAPCSSASQTVVLDPSVFYCDGQPGHIDSWGNVTLPGLSASDYAGATLTLFGADGTALPGWTNVAFPSSGPQTIDISSIPVTGNTAKLTAQVNLAAVNNPAAVNASRVRASWVGDPIQVCYETTVNPVACLTTVPLSNTATAVTTAGAVTDAPGGNSSGAAIFDVTPSAAQCMLHLTKTGAPDPARPGTTVTYTIKVQNTGTMDYLAAGPASFTDDITDVLQDSSYNTASLTASSGTASYDPTSNVISWSGALAANATATITYTVTVDDPDNGDHSTFNRVVTPAGTPSNCAAASTDPACAATVPVQSFRVVKTTTATDVTPGETVDYTVTVTNTGAVAYTAANPASFSDDLTAVLDDATYNNDATATAGAASYAAPTLSWSGPLAVGDTVTVTYSVTVNSPDTGDQKLDNTVVTPTGSGGNCPTGSTDPACSAAVPAKAFSVVKTASESTANAGDTVTYTLTVTNTGAVDYTAADPAALTDDMTGVLDDAIYKNDVSATAGTVGYTSPMLSWSGPLPVGSSVTITYSVTVNVPDTGDHRLQNTVTDPPGSGGSCVPGNSDPACHSTVPVRSYTVDKTSSVSNVQPGDSVTYTITIINTGAAAYTAAGPAALSDDLTNVLDDAAYNNDAAATGGTASYAAPKLTWSGPLPVGATVTVTYSVRVDNPDTGDGILSNAADPTSPGGGCANGAVAPCPPVKVPVASYTVTKTSSAAGTVHPGETVTYTITVHNPSQGDYTAAKPATVSDDLTAVLDDATYNSDAAATAGTASYAAPTLTWSGPLAAGASVTITYTVTVNAPDTGDHTLSNAADPTAPGGGCSTGSAPPCAPVVNQVRSFAVRKTASTTGPVHPGDTVTYTITVTNTGAAAYTAAAPAFLTDNLAAVLDDATYNKDVSATSGTVGYAAPTLSWSGPLAVGATVTITYTVTVNTVDAGDHTLANAVATPPGSGGNCPSGSTDPVCSVTLPVQSFSVVKTVDKTKVTPGEKVTYTITVTNTGTVDYTAGAPASFTDSLSSVLDDATYGNDAVASAGTVSYSAPTLSWSGALAIGATVTVSYSATVEDPDNGDQRLANTVVTPTGSGGNCPTSSTNPQCTANVPGNRLQVTKTASSSTAAPGQKVTYTVTVTNTGQNGFTTANPASLTDDLSRVLDDATYNGDASNGARVTGSTLTWSGPLAIGATVTITYSVTVNRRDAGDKILANTVSLPPGENSNCSAGSTDPDCRTVTPVKSYDVVKTGSAATVRPGDTVTYTITVTNTGQVAYTTSDPASFTDDMSDVLDDATYNHDASGRASFSGHTLSWSGALPVGGTVTITYSVTVNNPDTGDGTLNNVVTTPTGPHGFSVGGCPTGSADPDCHAVAAVHATRGGPAPPGGTTAYTGNDTRRQLLLAGLLLGVGCLFALAGARWRRRTA